MKITLAYTCVANGPATLLYATRFIATYYAFPPGYDHDIVLISNGGEPSTEIKAAFASMQCRYFPRSNDGWDIGGYIEIANNLIGKTDALLCLGESVYFHRPGWIARFAECWQQYGIGMYGPFASNVLRPHLQTSAFMTSPELLNSYPVQVLTKDDRYAFEHGSQSFMGRILLRGLQARLVTWDGCWTHRDWRIPRNVIWKGDQSNCLMWCNHVDNFNRLGTAIKKRWTQWADAALSK